MSYSIEYNSIFLKSKQGYTPVILMGDNNVWSCDGKRRERSWSCWCNLCGVDAEEILQKIENMQGQQLWMKNGKWVDDQAAMRWAKNGIKKAAALEDFLKWNHMRCVECFLTEYEENTYHSHVLMRSYCTDNDMFDRWISAAKNLQRARHSNMYITISFSREDVHQPTKIDGPVVLKEKGMYVSDFSVCDGKADSVSLDDDVTKAKVFDSVDNLPNLSCFGMFYPVKAKNVTTRKDIVLQIISGPYTNYYIRKCTAKNLFMTRYLESAQKYASKSGAEQAQSRIQQKFNTACKLI